MAKLSAGVRIRRILTNLAAAFVITVTCCFSAFGFHKVPYSGGSGTAADPYKISAVADWQELMVDSNNWNKRFILTANLDLAGITLTPVGNSTKRFTGVFNGGGYVIRNALMNQPAIDYVGLFGCLGSGGVVTALYAEDANIIGRRYVGVIAGHNSRGTISNCHSSGSVAAVRNSSYVGGIAGLSFSGTISNCYSTAGVSGTGATLGGLVGVNSKGTISDCRAEGNVKCSDPNNIGSYAGGLAGSNFGTISDSYAAGDVNVISAYSLSSAIAGAGGLTGDNCGTITNSYATGKVYTKSISPASTICLGGLVGLKSDGDVNNCYCEGAISRDGGSASSYYAGGLVGLNYDSAVSSSYSTSLVDVNIPEAAGSCVGGFVGLNLGGWVYECFWDIQTSGKSASGGGNGQSTEQMKTAAIYQNAGWAGKGWVIDDGVDYPRLLWEGTGGIAIPVAADVNLFGSGIAGDPYQIWTAADFASLSGYDSILDKKIKLMADIDLSNTVIYPIGGLKPFTGTFDGNGHILRNARINQPTTSFVGLFGYVGAGAAITNLGVEDVNILGGDFVGGLIGKNAGGTVNKCYSIGIASGFSYIGGLIGSNDGGSVNDCYTSGKVAVWDTDSSASYAGGLIGDCNSGSIATCYSSSLVTGAGSFIGGLIGRNGSGTLAYLYWDTQTSGRSVGLGSGTSTNVVGKITAEMKTKSTFSHWDFVRGMLDGTNDIWRMCVDGVNYPKLSWEYIPNRDFTCPDGVELADYSFMAARWLNTNCAASNNCNGADLDFSGTVDWKDLKIFAESWLDGR